MAGGGNRVIFLSRASFLSVLERNDAYQQLNPGNRPQRAGVERGPHVVGASGCVASSVTSIQCTLVLYRDSYLPNFGGTLRFQGSRNGIGDSHVGKVLENRDRTRDR